MSKTVYFSQLETETDEEEKIAVILIRNNTVQTYFQTFPTHQVLFSRDNRFQKIL